MKKLIEGNQLLDQVPVCHAAGREPVVRLQHNLILDDRNCFESPMLIEGNVGTGKTTLMREIMNPILEYCERSGDNAVIFCAKPDMLKYCRPGDPVISIRSEDPASCWNIFEEVKHADDPELTLREIAAGLFAEAEEKSTNVFFPQSACDIFYRSCTFMYDYAIKNGISFSNADLVEFLDTTPIRGTDDTPGWMELAEEYPEYFSPIPDYLGDGSEQGLGCLSELRTLISRILFGSFASDAGTFSAIGALKDGHKRIFLYYDYANSGHSTLAVYQILLDLLLKQGMRADAQQKTWYFLDEASLLPKMKDTLTDALSLGRDPGSNGTSGVRIIMALQSARLMTHHYSREEAETLLSLFPNVIALRVSDPMSRNVISNRYGKAHYLYSYVGIGEKIHYQDSIRDAVSDYDFSRLTEKGQAIMSMPGISNQPFFYDGYRKEQQ